MPDDLQLSGSEGGSGDSVSDAERMGEESEVGQDRHTAHNGLVLIPFVFLMFCRQQGCFHLLIP